jgi:DNA-binding NtrC family response regulator
MAAPPGPAVLIADDEPLLRRLMKRVLETSDLRVITAADGDEALAALLAEPHQIRVIVIDLVMPPDGGLEVLQRMLKIRPDLGVVLTSGLPPEAAADALVMTRRASFLQKPFAPEALRRAVAELLTQAH